MFYDYGKRTKGMTSVMGGRILAILICMAVWLISAGPAHSDIIINAPMTDTDSTGWTLGGNPTSILTGNGAIDPSGQGWLRLTNSATQQKGFAYNNTSFDLSQGVLIQYDYVTWGGTGADGYSVYLYDAGVSPFNIGAYGGSLGYAQMLQPAVPTDIPGISGGYVGIGIDEYGNYAVDGEGRSGGSATLQANTVTIRGSVVGFGGGAIGQTTNAASYPWIATSANNGSLWYNGATRPSQTGANYRRVVIRISPAPNPVADVWIQFGYNQPLTQMLSSQALPTISTSQLLKIGYAASSGGMTNYHEIRNLLVTSLNTSTNIDLGITKTASVASATSGTPITYTVTAGNYGPNNITATGVGIVDTVPAYITGVTWTCAASAVPGTSCGAASGSGNNISTTANLPMNGTVTYTINGTISAPNGTQIINTASLTVPGGINDYTPTNNSASATTMVTNGANVNITGTLFNDNGAGGGTAHDGIRNGGEAVVTATNVGNTYYVKVYRANDFSALVGYATVSGGASTYSVSVPAYGAYSIILSTDNTASFTPSLSTNGQWIYTQPLNYTLTNVTTSGANFPNQNFGVVQGSRISGKVILDNGAGGGTANDGVQNGSETGIGNVTVRLTNNTGGTTYDTTTTDSAGNFALFYNNTGRGMRIYESNNPASYVSVNANVGNTGGTYNIGGDYISFTYVQYTDYSGVIFSDVPPNTFTPATATAYGSSVTPVYYSHTFTPGSGGSVIFSTNSHNPTVGSTIVYYRDTDCSHVYNASDPVITAGVTSITATAGVPVCILMQVTIPGTAANNATDTIVTRAAFTYTNSAVAPVSYLSVTDTTTVVWPPNLTVAKYVRNVTAPVAGGTPLAAPAGLPAATYYLTGVNGKPGDVLEYLLVISNTGSSVGAATAVTASDAVPTYTTLVSSSAAYGANNTGGLTGTFAQALRNGTLQAFKVDGSTGSATVGYGKSTSLTGEMTFYLGNGSTSSAGGTINASETDYVVYEVTIK